LIKLLILYYQIYERFFKPEEENIVYMTLIQSPMVNGLNSAGFHLQDNSSSEIVDQIFNMLQGF
jgi:hypothetical protein